MRISIDEARCVGGGQCVHAAEDVFDQRDDDGVAVLLVDPEIDAGAEERVRLAAALCPAQAIRLE